MLKRTKGRLLLTLLVITGLAGTIHDTSLSQKERKTASTVLKNSRADMLNSVEGLNPKQLRYKISPDQLSVEDYIFSAVETEIKYHEEIKSRMKKPSNPEKRSIIRFTDSQALSLREPGYLPLGSVLIHPDANLPFNRTVEALIKFQSLRQEHIKYIRTSTEDLRNHVIETSAGYMDAYQYMLTLAAQTNYIVRQINEIKTLPGFPQK